MGCLTSIFFPLLILKVCFAYEYIDSIQKKYLDESIGTKNATDIGSTGRDSGLSFFSGYSYPALHHLQTGGGWQSQALRRRRAQRRRPISQHFYKIYIYPIFGLSGKGNVSIMNGERHKDRNHEKFSDEDALNVNVDDQQPVDFIDLEENPVDDFQGKSKESECLPAEKGGVVKAVSEAIGLPVEKTSLKTSVEAKPNKMEITIKIVNVTAKFYSPDDAITEELEVPPTSEEINGTKVSNQVSLSQNEDQPQILDGLVSENSKKPELGKLSLWDDVTQPATAAKDTAAKTNTDSTGLINSDPSAGWTKTYGKHSYEDLVKRKLILDKKTKSHFGIADIDAPMKNEIRKRETPTFSDRYGIGSTSVNGGMDSKKRFDTRTRQNYNYDYIDEYDFPEE